MLENLTDPQIIVLAIIILIIIAFLITTIVLQKKGWFDESEIDKRRMNIPETGIKTQTFYDKFNKFLDTGHWK